MQILRALALAGVAVNAYGQPAARPEVVEVRAVPDGHTIEVSGGGRVRLAGIRAPKPPRGAAEGEPFGREARERLEGIVIRRFVRLEVPAAGSRSSAYVLLEDGTFVNAILVREGLARLSGRPSGARGDELQRAEASAKASRRGLWGAPHSARSATSGSTRVARRAGNTHAQIATTARIAVIDAKVTGSRGVTSTSNVPRTCPRK